MDQNGNGTVDKDEVIRVINAYLFAAPGAPTPPISLADLENGAWLEENKPDSADRIKALPWVANGVDDAEREAAEDLIRAARWYPGVFDVLMEMSWVRDSVVTADEAKAIRQIRWAAQFSAELSKQMAQKPWVQDGITTTEADAMQDLAWTIREAPALAERMLELSWVQDNITTAEAHTIYGISGATRLNLELAEKMLQKPWLQDGITRDEGIIIRRLYWLAGRTDEATQQKMVDVAVSIIDMPFLDDVTFAEARAVMSLYNLTGSRYQDSFRAIMSHPKVQDGITDQESKVIAVLRTPARYKPEMVPPTAGQPRRDGRRLPRRTHHPTAADRRNPADHRSHPRPDHRQHGLPGTRRPL